MPKRAAVILLLALAATGVPTGAQRPADSQANLFGGLAGGPYKRLVILNAMVIPGHGGPPAGPYDIVVEGNTIAQMTALDPVTAQRRETGNRPSGDRVIDASGMYVMPGLIDLHMHLRNEPMELDYVYYLKLAHGVTTMAPAPDRGLEPAMQQARLSAENKLLAPRMYPLWSWNSIPGYSRAELEDPKQAARIAREIAAKGMRVVSLDSMGWDQELFGAICKAVWEAGGITTVHLPPATNAVINAVDAARLGVTMIEHHYAYAEASLDRKVQDFPREYNFNDEGERFRHAGKVWTEANRERLLTDVAQKLADSGVTMLPTRVVYEANRDILRAESLPWHEKYTHQALWQWNLPNPAFHGSFHWDWTSDDEAYWSTAFELWGKLIYEFNKRGGRVGYGTDDNYIWATPGFSNIRELQLNRESGVHSLEALKFATRNSALTLREPKLGLVRPGYTADLVLVDGNPAYNLRFMYAFGAITRDRAGQMRRTRGIVHTIKDGLVIENTKLMTEVERMVAKSKEHAKPDIVTSPFVMRRTTNP